MNNLINPEDRNKTSNCVSHHDDICFADNSPNEDKEDQD
tara:strand:+ start:527 stop:643 length:117 start_codon:yes stop_codon:yes gene_type:complete